MTQAAKQSAVVDYNGEAHVLEWYIRMTAIGECTVAMTCIFF